MGCCQSHILQSQNVHPIQDCIIQISHSQISSQKSIKQNIYKNNKDKEKYQPICPEQIRLDNQKNNNKLSFLDIQDSVNFTQYFPQSGYTLRVIQDCQISQKNIQTSRSIKQMKDILDTMILKFQRVEGGYSKKLIPLNNNNTQLTEQQIQYIKQICQQNKQNKCQTLFEKQSNASSQLKPKNLERQSVIPTAIKPLDLNIDIKAKNKSEIITKKIRHSQGDQQSQESSSQSYSKCLLSNPSQILNQTLLLTQRQRQKQIFYNKYTQIQLKNSKYLNKRIQLENWSEIGRQSLQIDINKILQIYQNCQSAIDSYFGVVMMAVGLYKTIHNINLIAYIPETHEIQFKNILQRQQNTGIRLFLNGKKRLFCLNQLFQSQNFQQNELNKLQVLKEVIQILHFSHNLRQKQESFEKNPAQIIYNLTGWIPQQINLEDITNVQGVLERLSNNFNDGNTLITFTTILNIKKQNKQKQVKINFTLKNIDLNQQKVILYGFISSQIKKQFLIEQIIPGMKLVGKCMYEIQWQKLVQKIQSINVNWNISIYDFSYRFQSIFSQNQSKQESLIKKADRKNINENSYQYLLKIPPNQQDIQVRLFLQTHHQYPACNSKSDSSSLILIQLYDYAGNRVNSYQNFIRQLSKGQNIWSDVLIFQASKQKNQYILVVRLDQGVKQQQIQFTLNLYSFTQVILTELSQQKIIFEREIRTFINPSNTGYGINSPFFLKNIHFALNVPINSNIKIFVQAPELHKFQICVVGDTECRKNITKINLQGILTDINCSQQLQTRGYFDFVSKYSDNIIILTSYTQSKGPIKIIVQCIEKFKKSLILPNINQNVSKSIIKFQEISSYQKSIFSKQIKWFPTNPGPRKRLKSNTNSQFQQYSVFSEFFKNPYIDYKISQTGVYQFSITSDTYQQIFKSKQTLEQKQDLEPITLSMSIFESGQGGKSFKIIMDDAFYVPFGFGFWSKQMFIESGNYRFVFPKMQRESGNGTFSIYRVS